MSEASIFVQKETLSTWQQKAQRILEGLRQIERSKPDDGDTVVKRIMRNCVALEAGLRHTLRQCVNIAGLDNLDDADC